MHSVHFLFGVHNHQPVGNFGWVFEDGFEKCYRPFIETLEKFPAVRIALHFTGPLLEWIETNRAGFFSQIRELVSRGQIEIMGGGFYEPILSVLPPEDAAGQVEMMTDYLAEKFGVRVRGAWLAERIWEPIIPEILAGSGIEYTVIDESHFRYAGLSKDRMIGYYMTESKGSSLAIFPIDMELRYRIPFKLPEQSIDYLREVDAGGGSPAITYADDGEKFGVWPGTHKWVYGEKWLEKFFKSIEENRDWIQMPTFSEYIDSHPATGRIYLPTSSYEEMMQWSLPAGESEALEDIVEELKSNGQYDRYFPFIRGGFWSNFLVKYPEANLLHKKMLRISKQVRQCEGLEGESADEALVELWRGQCNCPYWHGLFGGLYLNSLRHAVYHHLLNAQKIAERQTHGDADFTLLEETDLDCDGDMEVLVEGNRLNAYLSPSYGGAVFVIDAKPQSFHLTNVLARRKEAYHRKILQAVAESKREDGKEAPSSIHDVIEFKESGLEKLLHYDWYNRYCFLDHFIGPEADIEDFSACRYKEAGDFVNQPYRLAESRVDRTTARIRLVREGGVWIDGERRPIHVGKDYSIDPVKGTIRADYRITNPSDRKISVRFGSEINLTLLAGDAPDRYYRIPGVKLEEARMAGSGETKDLSEIEMIDEYFGIRVAIEADPAAVLWRFPVETVSQSEGGFERTYQGSCLLFVWRLEIEPGAGSERTLLMRLEEPK